MASNNGATLLLWLLFLLCLHGCIAWKERAKSYCPKLFEQTCPLIDNVDSFGQIKCIVGLYERHELLAEFDEKCIKLAVGMYQTHNLAISKKKEASIENFDKPTECTSIGSSIWNNKHVDAGNVDFTLVSQCSQDRLWMVGEICKSWGGDIIVAVSGVGSSVTSIKGCGNIRTSLPNNYDVSVPRIVSGERQVIILPYQVDLAELYPVNKLRNRAMCGVRTSHLFYTDIDLWPSPRLYEELHKSVKLNSGKFTDPRHATIVAAFQVSKTPRLCRDGVRSDTLSHKTCNIRELPRNMTSLRRCLSYHYCTPMDHLGNPEGHASTNFNLWYKQTQFRPLSCFRSSRYEPYLVLPTSSETPVFDEEFRGYGKNKIQHVKHLQARGFVFSVLPHEFVIHFPHQASEARISWDLNTAGTKSQQELNNDMYTKYLKWIKQTYNDNAVRTPVCVGVREQLTYSERSHFQPMVMKHTKINSMSDH